MDNAVVIATDRINALHGVRDAAKLASLTASMRADGWQGRPLLGEMLSDGYTVRLWTGSHRFAAAVKAGLDEVPVALVNVGAIGVEAVDGRDGLGECIINAFDDESGALAALAVADPAAAALLAMDVA